jgi:hypothetical protein
MQSKANLSHSDQEKCLMLDLSGVLTRDMLCGKAMARQDPNLDDRDLY